MDKIPTWWIHEPLEVAGGYAACVIAMVLAISLLWFQFVIDRPIFSRVRFCYLTAVAAFFLNAFSLFIRLPPINNYIDYDFRFVTWAQIGLILSMLLCAIANMVLMREHQQREGCNAQIKKHR